MIKELKIQMNNELKATNEFSNKSGENFPLYCQYAGQSAPQSAYITLCLETGDVNADYADYGGSWPEAVFHNRVLHFSIDACTHANDINQIIDENLNVFQDILNRTDIQWDNNNYVGQFIDGSEMTFSELETETAMKINDDYEKQYRVAFVDIDCVNNYIYDHAPYLKAGQTIEEKALEIIKMYDEETLFTNVSIESISECLVEFYFEKIVSSRAMLPTIKYLLKNINDYSEWKMYEEDLIQAIRNIENE